MRFAFGATLSAWTFATAPDGITPQLEGGINVTLWNAQTGGTRVVDLASDAIGSVVFDSVTTSTGSDGAVIGTIPEFWGPNDGTTVMWAEAAGGPRLKMVATDVGVATNALTLSLADLATAVDGLQGLSAISVILNMANSDGTWNPRPALAGPRMVLWVGPNFPTAGGTGMAENDVYGDTLP